MLELTLGDKNYRIEFTVMREEVDEVVDLTGANVRFKYQKVGTDNFWTRDATVTDPTEGKCVVQITDADFPEVGEYLAELEIEYPALNKIVTTKHFTVKVKKDIPV